ncbi:fatty acyl-CoA reductase 1 [Helicoverpa armigera]|uniref:fatty acyl-CoA reductase 1 n=1 Tax=Helicoverpa armigera TaxID=29058 RepID=UPI0030834763
MDAAQEVIFKAVECQKGTKEIIARGDSAVQQFYCGATVFVTGGSGFLGKQLVEKLFRTCKLKKTYVLMRAKKGKSVEERLAEIYKDPLYDSLREEQPDFINKIVPIIGELSEKDLAFSKNDKEKLIKEVDVIFHVAASVYFEAPLRSATFTNVRGTRDLLRLAKQCKKLRSFIYVSTAYSHATFSRRDTRVLEQFYPSPVPPDLMIEMAETMDEDRINLIKDGIINDWPNTYAFTKALAEDLVRSHLEELPIFVVRPSIIVCAKKEPYPGWIDISSMFGPSGITLGCMLGVIHALQSVQDIRIDFIPVDYVSNVAIVAAANTNKKLRVYNIASSNRNPITWACGLNFSGGLSYILNNVARRTIISPQAIWYCFAVQSPYKWVFELVSFFLHTIPSNLADAACVLVKKPPRLKKTYATITKMATTVAFYTNNNWIFEDNNTVELFSSLSAEDKVIFHCDATDINWTEQIVLWCVGLRKYIVKDGLKDTEWGMKKQFYFRVTTYVVSGLLALILLWLTCHLSVFIKNVFS